MKSQQSLLTLFISLLFFYSSSQELVKLKDLSLKSTTTPAFLLLDESPTAIENPENLGSFAAYIYNNLGENSLAVESNWYWWFNPEKDNSYAEYRGFKFKDSIEKKLTLKTKMSPFKGFTTNTSFSLAFVEKEFDTINGDKKAISLGFRTNFFNFYNKKRKEKLVKAIKGLKYVITGSDKVSNEELKTLRKKINNADLTKPSIEVLELWKKKKDGESLKEDEKKKLEKYEKIAEIKDKKNEEIFNYYMEERLKRMKKFYYNKDNIKPNIRADFGMGYGILFNENSISSTTNNRFASWMTLNVSFNLSKKDLISVDKRNKSYLNVYGIGRYIDDGFSVNTSGQNINETFWDYGGKIELEFNRLRFSYEYLKRDGTGNQYRSVGNINFQFSKKINITGGFGKDFPEENNLVSLLGINLGIDLGKESVKQ